MKLPSSIVVALVAVSASCPHPAVPTGAVDLAGISRGAVVHGFRVEARYTGAGGVPLGARLVHEHTGFVLDLVRSRTVPQGYLYVNTVPDSDRGEPHTQEHLLLGKGNKGRGVSTADDLWLVQSSAFTQTLRTVYHFHTTAGPDVFFDTFQRRVDALLHPDYTDEEVRREVHHYGVAADPTSGELHLEEKGTVYAEMASSFQRPWGRLWRSIGQTLYGADHPEALSSGGMPEAIREMTPEHIRTFHARNYQLGNMGMVAVLSDDIPLDTALERFDAAFHQLQPHPTPADAAFVTEAGLPPPKPSSDHSVRQIRFPEADAAGASTVHLAWPPTRDVSERETWMASLFLGSLAGSENSNLYRALVDSETRERDLGITGVWAWMDDTQGHPVHVSIAGMPGTSVDDDVVAFLVDRVRQELATIAGLAPEHPSLADLDRRVASQKVAWVRSTRKWASSPPGFGFRGTGSSWFDTLQSLDRIGGFERSLVGEPGFAWVDEQLAAEGNIWTARLEDWGLLHTEPYVFVNRPDPALPAALDRERAERLAAEEAKIVTQRGGDTQAALQAFAADYDAQTAKLDALAAAAGATARFVEHPPLTTDDSIQCERSEIAGVPTVTSRFDVMTGAWIRLHLDATRVAPEHEHLIAALPRLLSDVGVILDGTPVSYQEVIERVQNGFLSMGATYSAQARTGRLELAITAAGTDPAETRTAVGWLATLMHHPDWREENLPRLRDVVDDVLDGLRRVTQRSEESWVDNPAQAWQYQGDGLQLRTWSALTRVHDLLRMRWLLREATSAEVASEVAAALAVLRDTELDRAGRMTLLGQLQGDGGAPPETSSEWVHPLGKRFDGLSEAANGLLKEAAIDLARTLPAIPDASLTADWVYLCRMIAGDLARDPSDVLAELDALRTALLHRGGARLVIVGSSGVIDAVRPDLEAVVGTLASGEAPRIERSPARHLTARLAGRGADPAPVHVGFVDPSRQSGTLVLSVPGATYADIDDDDVLDHLTGLAMAGGGAHSAFIKTWGAGLAYSNGIRPSVATGRLRYYAERSPELGQTMGFVIDQVAGQVFDDRIAEYAIAQAFDSREASGFEDRGSAIAADLVDGRGPEVVRAFRERVLDLRDRPGLADELNKRKEAVYGRVLPGYGVASAAVDGGAFMALGPESQLAAWEAWLRVREGDDVRVQRLYPRDFWIPAPEYQQD